MENLEIFFERLFKVFLDFVGINVKFIINIICKFYYSLEECLY